MINLIKILFFIAFFVAVMSIKLGTLVTENVDTTNLLNGNAILNDDVHADHEPHPRGHHSK